MKDDYIGKYSEVQNIIKVLGKELVTRCGEIQAEADEIFNLTNRYGTVFKSGKINKENISEFFNSMRIVEKNMLELLNRIEVLQGNIKNAGPDVTDQLIFDMERFKEEHNNE